MKLRYNDSSDIYWEYLKKGEINIYISKKIAKKQIVKLTKMIEQIKESEINIKKFIGDDTEKTCRRFSIYSELFEEVFLSNISFLNILEKNIFFMTKIGEKFNHLTPQVLHNELLKIFTDSAPTSVVIAIAKRHFKKVLWFIKKIKYQLINLRRSMLAFLFTNKDLKNKELIWIGEYFLKNGNANFSIWWGHRSETLKRLTDMKNEM